jgi:hypothetical protein
MRSLRSFVLSALLLASTATSTFAHDITSSLELTIPASEHTYDDGGGYARPALPGSGRLNDDGGGYARPTLPGVERANDDGGGYTSPATTPADRNAYERWV